MKRIILHVFGRILNSKNILEINHLFELLCYVLCSRKTICCSSNKVVELEQCVKGEIVFSNELPEDFEDDNFDKENGLTY